MKIAIDPQLAENPSWQNAIAGANEFLLTLPGAATGEMEAAWHRVPETADRASLALRYHDPDVSASRLFLRVDVENLAEFERKMRWYWEDFLRDVSRALGARIREKIAVLEDD